MRADGGPRARDEGDDDRTSLSEALDELGRQRSEALAAQPTEADERAARAYFEPRFAARGTTRTARRIAWPLAAAALLALVVGGSLLRTREPAPSVVLGRGIVGELTSPGTADAAFRWDSDELPVGGAFVVTVRDERGRTIVESARLTTPHWSPAPADRARLQAHGALDWEVVAIDANGQTIGYGSERCSLSSP